MVGLGWTQFLSEDNNCDWNNKQQLLYLGMINCSSQKVRSNGACRRRLWVNENARLVCQWFGVEVFSLSARSRSVHASAPPNPGKPSSCCDHACWANLRTKQVVAHWDRVVFASLVREGVRGERWGGVDGTWGCQMTDWPGRQSLVLDPAGIKACYCNIVFFFQYMLWPYNTGQYNIILHLLQYCNMTIYSVLSSGFLECTRITYGYHQDGLPYLLSIVQ